MKATFHRKVVPALLLVQVAYVALLELAFTFLVPDTGEIDHTDPRTSATVMYAALVVAAVVAMTGGAVLMGSARVRDRAPRVLRGCWLALLGIGEIAVAVMFLRAVATGSMGPDTLIGVLAAAVSCAVALSCLTEAGTVLRGTPA
ncbi:hypothetical protein ACFCV8_09765 [Streptomyces sp. NPDC056347]|uniref:hypothetical protein n=1 Tax=Streptomyces sp. NPDC056347 TaxID=3345790 RepID=UPI0035DBF889